MLAGALPRAQRLLLARTPSTGPSSPSGRARACPCRAAHAASAAMAATAPPSAEVVEISSNKQFGGFNRRFRHRSAVLGCDMTFTIYYPPAAEQAGAKVPLLYFLSGLTCNDENFIQKSGAQRQAAARGVALVAPDTSPRGLGVEGEAESWDFGVGAGFYVNATQEKWAAWRMYDYVVEELAALLRSAPCGAALDPDRGPELPALLRSAPCGATLDPDRASVFGHSMGGHGALVVGLRNPQKYRSISAFSPICNPSNVPWGIKALTGGRGGVDGAEGYDHSYYFISTFVDEHINFHADALAA
ncbi:S-formylglutathione hydrolase [Tetrabaena socialis]|uniref:S-formylglutathione hydrolase n=1 Tax=Tetrabaena socialis TaxID=47790 RepID=A0A2J8AFD5_9CHLO|nr:S-formylglutathione hydrolase [Tetrabaena socialis]|eukprot:PNH11216.1 S-formylglutathione hydrolase [Tetrabaena socialis]